MPYTATLTDLDDHHRGGVAWVRTAVGCETAEQAHFHLADMLLDSLAQYAIWMNDDWQHGDDPIFENEEWVKFKGDVIVFIQSPPQVGEPWYIPESFELTITETGD